MIANAAFKFKQQESNNENKLKAERNEVSICSCRFKFRSMPCFRQKRKSAILAFQQIELKVSGHLAVG